MTLSATALRRFEVDAGKADGTEQQLAQFSADVSALVVAAKTNRLSATAKKELTGALDAFVDLGQQAGELSAKIGDYLRRHPPSAKVD